MTTNPPLVCVEVEARVATITLNRPEVRNALNRRLMNELWDAVTSAQDDADIDVVIVTGADPAFCAGVDLKEVSGQVPPPASPPPPGAGPPPGRARGFRV